MNMSFFSRGKTNVNRVNYVFLRPTQQYEKLNRNFLVYYLVLMFENRIHRENNDELLHKMLNHRQNHL